MTNLAKWLPKTTIWFTLDDYGNILETIRYEKDGSVGSTYYFKYDKNGNTIENSWYDENGELNNLSTSKFDTKGNTISSEDVNGNGIKTNYSYTYQYDEKENWINRTSKKNGIPSLIQEREISYY